MKDDILIDLGEVSELTLGDFIGTEEGLDLDQRP